MFVPYTPESQLAKKLRQNEEVLAKITKSKLKIVERTGMKLQDVLTKSNPWRDMIVVVRTVYCATQKWQQIRIKPGLPQKKLGL